MPNRRRETLVALAVFVAVALVATYPLVLRSLQSLTGLTDPLLNATILAWDADRVRRLGSLWRDMRKHGVRIVAYLPPYHPVTWDLLRRDDGAMAGLVETRVALEALAAGAGASVFDLSNPASVPCGEDEFLDGNHARASCMTRILSRIGTRSP